MRADLTLKGRQAFWETPRNLVIIISTLVALATVIAGFVGFKIGQSQPPPVNVTISFPPGTSVQVPSAAVAPPTSRP